MALTAADRRDIAMVVAEWQAAFDRHDWVTLAACLTPVVTVDYPSRGGDGPAVQSAAAYTALRREALDHLDMHHHPSHLVITDGPSPGTATATCDIEVQRFERGSDRHYHSWGTYRLGLEADEAGRWRIAAVEQRISRNDGDPAIHGGMPTG
jgi:ketosteroid isomerase-like protein